ncbi:MAG: 50S ribosomal protein L13 [Candidatus Diapherotrites archaeon]|nr:50S ribosomal protein L13 [Candidatus Diapherotrites archaeon]
MIIIDGSNHVFGRLASAVAKRIISGNEDVCVVNAEKVVITGKKEVVMQKFRRRLGFVTKGNQSNSPKFPKHPDRLLKRSVRGMLPYPELRGRMAIKKFKAFIGVPKEFEGKKFEQITGALSKPQHRTVTVGEISRALGAKW